MANLDEQKLPQQEEQPILNITGDKTVLGPIERWMQPVFGKWLNDFEVTFLSGDDVRAVSKEEIAAQFERGTARDHGLRRENFAIFKRETLRLIGFCELRDINMGNRSAEYGILIGEKDCWSKGYGTEVTFLMLDYGFSVLGLHNILLSTYSYNERAIRAYTRAGFRIIGRRREMQTWSDKVYDEVFMDCLSTDFQTPYKRILTLP